MRDTAVWLPIVALLLAFVVFCYVQLIRRPARNLPKVAWAVIILAQIPLGGIGYLIFGRGDHSATAADPAVGREATRMPAEAARRSSMDGRATPAPAEVAAIRTRALTKVFHGGVGLHAVSYSA